MAKKKDSNDNNEIKKELPKLYQGIDDLGYFSIETNNLLEKMNKTLDSLNFSLNLKLATMINSFDTYFSEMAADRLRDTVKNDDQVKSVEPKKENPNFNLISPDSASSIAGNLLTALGMAFLAYKFDIGKMIQESGLIKILTGWIKSPFLAIGRAIKGMFSEGKLLSGIGKMFEMIAAPFKAIFGIVKGIFSSPIIKNIIGIVKFIGKTFFSIFKILNPFTGILTGILKFAGKLFLPFTIIMTIIDFFRGFMKADNWVDGIKMGIEEVITSLIGWPLEILKKLVVWVMKMFGWENLANQLDKLDFIKIITDWFDTFWNFFKAIFTLDFNKAFNILSDYYSKIWEGIKNIFWVLIDVIGNWVTNIGEWLVPILGSVWESIKKIFWDIVDSIGKWGDEIFKSIDDFVSPWIEMFTKPIKDIFSNISDLMLKMKDTILQKLRDWLPAWLLPDWAKDESYNNEQSEKEIKKLSDTIKEEAEKVERSKNGENVYWGRESKGQEESLQKIEAAKQAMKEIEIKREQNIRNQTSNQSNTIIVNNGGNTNNTTSSVNVNNISGTPTTSRPDR